METGLEQTHLKCVVPSNNIVHNINIFFLVPCPRDSGNDFLFSFPFLKISSSIKKLFLFGYPKYNSRFYLLLGYPKISSF